MVKVADQKRGGGLNAIISLLGLSSQQISGLVITVMAAGFLTASEYGVYTLGLVFVEFVVMMTYTGYYHFIINSEKDAAGVVSTMFWIMVAIGTVGGTAMVLGSAVLATAFDAPKLAPVLLSLGLMQPFASAAGWATAVLMREGLMRRYFLSMSAANFGAMTLGAIALVQWKSVFALVVFQGIKTFLNLLFFGISVPRRPRMVFDRTLARQATSYARGLYGSGFLGFFTNFGTDLVLVVLFSTAESGLFRFANRLATASVDLVATPLHIFALRSFGQASRLGRPLHDTFALFFGARVLLMGGFALTLFVMGGSMVELMFQPEFAAAIVAMQAIAVRAAARVGAMMIEPTFAAQKDTRPSLYFNLGMAVSLLIVLILFSGLGFEALAMALAGVQILSIPVAMWMCARLGGVAIRPALRQGARSMILLAVYGLGLAALWFGFGASGLSEGIRLSATFAGALVLAGPILIVALRLRIVSLSMFADSKAAP